MFKKSSILFVFILILFAFISPASADYIGPDRDVTTYEVEEIDYGVWARNNDTAPYCLDKNGQKADACIICEWEGKPGNPCGDAEYSYKLGTRYDTVAVTTTYPPATIIGQLQNCTLQNGWCVTTSQIELNGYEPLAGQQILLIEGTRNADPSTGSGQVFACGEFEITCQIPLLEGTNTLEYWAISSWGDSSRKGTTTIKVDTVAPNLNLLVNGTLGLNTWYVSNTIITAEGADGTSGIYEKVLSVDNGNTWIPSTILSDGVYTVDIRITDNAYNVSTASTTLSVDTTTPTLSLSVSGTKGNNNYYVSKPKITATSNDATSGIALVQAKIDNGNWVDTNEITLPDGIHTYQFRVYDNAGNMTESSLGQIAVDTTPPSVEADEEINLGEIVFYTLQDNGSGLWIERIVIEDEDEKYKKIVWLQEISGNKIKGDILWDGKFPSNTLGTSADKTLAGVGEYYITFKISDQAGNETFYTTIVNVNPISYLQVIPEFIPPVSEEATSNESTSSEEESQSFGGNSTPAQPSETQNLISLTGTATAGASTNTTTSNILWGAGAMAVIGAATAYALEQQRQREEEEEQSYQQAQQQAEMLNQQEQQRIVNQWLEGQAILNAHIEQLESQGATAEQIAELREQGATQGFGTAHQNAGNLSLSLAQQAVLVQQSVHNHLLNEHQDQQDSYISPSEAAQNSTYNHLLNEHQDQQGVYVSAPQNESSQESVWNWAYNNQTELSFGTGLTIGAIAAIGIVAGVITAPAWLVIGGVALLTVGLIAGGTLLINNHFGLDLSANLVDNMITGVVPALTLTGVGYLIAFTAPLVMTTFTNACANNPTACTYVGPIIDFGEQAIIATQLGYYSLIGDQENVAITTVEWQLETNDGGMPGNTLANEVSQQLARLGDDVPELLATYGDDIIPLLLEHGDDAVDIIGVYGEEGIALLNLYGDDAVDLITTHGTPAINLMMDYGDDAIDLYNSGGLPVSAINEIIPEDYYDEVMNAFDDTPSSIKLNEDLIVYRYWSGDGTTEVGNWIALDPNLTPEQARQLFALPNSNLAINVTEFTIPAGTTIIFGEAAEQISSSWAGSYATGGGLQIYVPDASVLVPNN